MLLIIRVALAAIAVILMCFVIYGFRRAISPRELLDAGSHVLACFVQSILGKRTPQWLLSYIERSDKLTNSRWAGLSLATYHGMIILRILWWDGVAVAFSLNGVRTDPTMMENLANIGFAVLAITGSLFGLRALLGSVPAVVRNKYNLLTAPFFPLAERHREQAVKRAGQDRDDAVAAMRHEVNNRTAELYALAAAVNTGNKKHASAIAEAVLGRRSD